VNLLDELKLHVASLTNVVNENPKFFVAIKHYVYQLDELLRSPRERVSQDELRLLTRKIEEFYYSWRPGAYTPGIIYVPPRETSDSDSTVAEINKLVMSLSEMDAESFQSLFPSEQQLSPELDKSKDNTLVSPCIFIGHGRSLLWARLKMFLEDELNLATVAYESESRVDV